MIYFILFYEFFKIGLFSFGGGLAMLPLMENLVYKYNWLTQQEFLDIIAISQVTPGPIALNTATFIGHKTAGITGAVVATLSSALPSFIVILIVANIFYKIKDSKYKEYFFRGVKPVTVALITYAGLIIAEPTFLQGEISTRIKALGIFIWIFIAPKYIKINPVFILLITSVFCIFIL